MALILASAISIGAAATLPAQLRANATNQASKDLSLKISGLRNAKGNVLICVTQNAAEFPDCREDDEAQRIVIATSTLIDAPPLNVSLSGPGRYAVSLIHDENGNGKLDKLLLVPREGYGFSRNPAIHFGPPKFSQASFLFGNAPISESVKVKYSL